MSSSTTSRKKKLIINTVAVSLGCGSCRKPKLAFLYHPKLKHKKPTTYSKHSPYTSTSSTTSTSSLNRRTEYDIASAITFSPNADTPQQCWDYSDRYSRAVRGFGRVGGDSVAVEKDSDDPYLDFRQSMLQMILEKEIYSKDDMKELLNCFLQLNSPYHHEIIVRAFTEIWNGVFSVKTSGGGSGSGSKATGSSKLRCGYKARDF